MRTRHIPLVLLLAGATAVSVASPAHADGDTTELTSPIKAGSDANTVGEATFTRSTAPDGTVTVTVRGVVPDGIKESHVCSGSEPFTSRVSPGHCPQAAVDGNVATYTQTYPASTSGQTLYFQFHVVSKGNTAYAGWQPGKPFYGNVGVAAPGGGTPLPVGHVGGLALAGAAGVALWVASRRRRAVGQSTLD